jgi:hypothetical protein
VARESRLLLADDPEFVSEYEQNGFFPALSTDPEEPLHVFNRHLMDSIKAFFNDFIFGVNDFTRMPILHPVRERRVPVAALSIEGADCTDEFTARNERNRREIVDLIENARIWLEDQLRRFAYTSAEMDEQFRALLDSRKDSPQYVAQRDDLRLLHNRRMSQFLTEVRATRRQIRTLQMQMVNIEHLNIMVDVGRNFADENPNATFTVSNIGGFITIDGVERNPRPCSTRGCFCTFNGKPHKRYRSKRGTTLLESNGNVTDNNSCPVNVVYAGNLSDMNPFARADGIKITVLDDNRLQLKQQNKIHEAIAKGDLGRLIAVDDCMNSVLKYWYGEKTYYKVKNFAIWDTMTGLENAIKDSHLSYLEQAKMSDEMAQFLVDTMRIGDWYNDYDKFYKSVMSHANELKEKIYRAADATHN